MKQSLEKLNIALVHEWIVNFAGSEKVLQALAEMYPQADIFTTVYDREKVPEFANRNVVTSFLQNIPFVKSRRELLIPFAPFAFEQFDLSKYDLVISSTTMAAKGIITKPSTLHISYCHTPPRYLYEPNLDPRAQKGAFSWLRNKTMHDLRLWDKVASDRPDVYIANSRYVSNRITKYYKKDSTVIYPPVSVDRYFPAKVEDKKDYYLFVSRLVDYKRCDIVIEAFNDLGYPLKVIGYGSDEGSLQSKAKDNIEFLGGKFGEELAKYFREAKALVFAAEEDFGIVPVEALASGIPVIAYGVGGATESVEDGETGVFFDEQTSDSIVSAVKKFEKMKIEPQKCVKAAANFSKEIFKHKMSDFVEKKWQEYNHKDI
ncbi:MAG: glycosyltransferase [Candidatus Berkelbacteria bacterium]